MTEPTIHKPKRRYPNPERANLSKESLLKVNGWVDQLKPKLRGSKISRSDLINWLVAQKSEVLTEREVAELVTTYFDPVKALEWAVAEVKSAKSRGEEIDLGAFVSEKFVTKKPKTRRKKAAKEAIVASDSE